MTVLESSELDRLPIPFRIERVHAFCSRWGVKEFALFGSVLRADFGPGSDIDVLVAFDDPSARTLLDLAMMERELEGLFGRPVDLLERGGLEQSANPRFREEIERSARVVYAR